MSGARDLQLVHWTAWGVAAARFRLSRGPAELKAWAVAARPEEIDPADAGSMGGWLRGVLDGAGVKGNRAVVVVSRSSVILKKLDAPEGLRDEDIDGYVRMQLKRQGPIEGDDAGVGARRLPSGELLAAAMPADVLGFLREVMQGAGRRVTGVRLRADGIAAFASEFAGRRLLVHALPMSAELVVADGPHAVFAREAAITGGEGRAEALAVQIQRTRMGARASGFEVGEATVRFADADEAPIPEEALADAVGGTVSGFGPLAEGWGAQDNGLDARASAALAPLIGLASGWDAGAALDLAAARPATRGQRVRRVAMLGAAATLVLGGGVWTVAQQRLGDLRGRVEAAEGRAVELRDRYVASLTREARLRHLEMWAGLDPDWVGRLDWLSATLPAREEALLDELRGVFEGGVVFRPEKRGVYTNGAWLGEGAITLTLDGRAARRDAMTDLRARLLEGDSVRLTPRGADEDDTFSFRLTIPARGTGGVE